MSLISMHGAWLSFSDAPLLDNAELHIEDNERVCLVGRNGAGKSTLMKILNREQGLDDGRIIYEQDLIVARLQQDPPRNVEGSVYDFVAEGIEEQAEYLKRYHDISRLVMNDPSEKNLNELAKVQEQLDHHNLWQLENRINEVLAQLGLDPNVALSSLSGGWLRKAALGRALVSNPRVLLLDEPTNHLDIETIDWLEGFLKTFNGTIIFISHDRSFIRNMATRIVDLDRGKLVTYPGNYDQYLLEKEEALRVEELQNAEFDRKLAQEEVWIRQGIKARRTRNEGRVRALKAMRRERGERREVMGTAKMQVEEASRSKLPGYELLVKGALLRFLALLIAQGKQQPPAETADTQRLKTVLQWLSAHYAEALRVADAAGVCSFSASHFMRWFRQMTGQSFIAFLNEYRLNAAAEALQTTDETILTIASRCGFENLSYFNRAFKAHFGMTPREYRKK